MTTTKVEHASSDPFGAPLKLASTTELIQELFARVDSMVLSYIRPDDAGGRSYATLLKADIETYHWHCREIGRQAEEDYGF